MIVPTKINNITKSKTMNIAAKANKQKFMELIPQANIPIDIKRLNYPNMNNSTIPKKTPTAKTFHNLL